MTSIVLNSWKEIANYIGRGVRTVQRWEQLYDFPVHRPSGHDRSSVFALSEEIDHWLKIAPVKASVTIADGALNSPSHGQSVVLTVDDNEIHLYAVHKVLQAAGFQVVAARTGSEAIMRAFDQQPEAILLDVNLPDVNGYEVCRRLKAETETASIPVIFHTAMEMTEKAKQHAESVGASAFLAYPMHNQHLVMVVKGCIRPDRWPISVDRFNFDPVSKVE